MGSSNSSHTRRPLAQTSTAVLLENAKLPNRSFKAAHDQAVNCSELDNDGSGSDVQEKRRNFSTHYTQSSGSVDGKA